MLAWYAETETRVDKKIVLANIPAFPPVVLRVLDLLSTEQPDNKSLIREISLDATLSAQLLRMANSPLFGFVSRVHTVQQAVALLGYVRVQSLVMAVATANYMRSGLRTEALQKCWRHSMASAILAREFARACRASSQAPAPESAYSFGLLHDIGRLGLLVAYPAEYSRILKVADRDKVSLLDQEKLLFGVDHCEAGRHLLENCKLPEEFCQIVGRHHDPPGFALGKEAGGPLDSLLIGYLACQMADTLGYSVVTPLKPATMDELLALLPTSARTHFPSDPETLGQIIAKGLGEDNPLGDSPTAETEMELPAAAFSSAVPDFGASHNPAPGAGLVAAMIFTVACFVFFWFWAR
ncbi:MAG TPA: HDOD domain-containing protein [Bryobacteraceae bacterium]|jgi:HD-like signal output (HDOD) protein